MAILLAVGIILGILFLGILLLICCKICCFTPGSCLLKACPCIADLVRRCSGACSQYCQCCRSDLDKYEKYEELTTANNIPDVVDNPIYEPKKREQEAADKPVDNEDPAAGSVEIDGPIADKPVSNIQEAPLEKEVEGSDAPESGKPADMAPAGSGSDMNPHSLADIDSIQQDTTQGEGEVKGKSHMSCGVITPPRRYPPEKTESVEHIVGPSGSIAEEDVKKGPVKKGPTKDTLRPRDWGGADGGNSQYSYDPDEDNFDVDFDQESITETAPSKQFSWMKSLTPINSLSGISSNGHHDHKIKSFESLTDTTTETFNTKKVRRQSRMIQIPDAVLLGLGKIPDQKAAIEFEYDPTVIRSRRLSISPVREVKDTTNVNNTTVKKNTGNRPYPDIVVKDIDDNMKSIYKDIDSMKKRSPNTRTTTSTTVEKHINIVTNSANVGQDVEKALLEEQKKLKKLQKEIEKERRDLEKAKRRQTEADEDRAEQDQLNALLAAVTDNKNVKRISVVSRGGTIPNVDTLLTSKISEESEETDDTDTISARRLVTILAKHKIQLDDDDKLELMESVKVKGMKGNNDLIEEMVTSKAAQLKKVEEGEEEAILDLIRSKVLISGVTLPDDIESKILVGLKNKITIGQEAGISAASRSRFVSDLLEKLKDEMMGGGGVAMSTEQINSLIAKVSGKLSVKLSSQQSLELVEAVKVKAAERGMTEGMLTQWVTKILLKCKISNKIDLGSELAGLRAALEQKIGASLGLSLEGDGQVKLSQELVEAILAKRGISLSAEDKAELMESVTIGGGMAGDAALLEEMIASKALQLKAVEDNDDEAMGDLIRSKLLVSGFALPGDMEASFIAGLKEKIVSQQAGMGAAARSRFVADMLAKLKGDISSDGGLVMSEEAMMSMITRVSGKYSAYLSVQQTQALIEGIKVKAAQQGTTEGMLEQWVTKVILKFKISNKIEIESEISALRSSLTQKIGSSLGLSGFTSAGLGVGGKTGTMRRVSVISTSASGSRF